MSIKFWTIFLILLFSSSIVWAYWEVPGINTDTNSFTHSSVINAASSTIVNLVTATFSCPSCIANSSLVNSTISGIALGQTLNALTATNGTLTFSGSYTGAAAQNVGLNLNSGNAWTASTTFHTGNFGVLNATSSVYLGSLTLGTKLANAQLANNSITINTTAPITGGATPALGETITIACASCSVFGYPFTVLSPTLNSTSTIISFTNGLASTSVLGSFNTGTITATSGTSYLQALTLGTKLPNAQLANSSIVINTALPLGGGATANLGDTVSLTCTGCATFAYPFTVLSPTLNSTSTIISFTNGLASTSILGSLNIGTLTATSGTSYLQALTLGTKLANAQLANSSLTYTAGNGLTGGGAVSLGNSATIDVAVDSTLSVSADSLGLNLNTGNLWTASTTFHTGNFGVLNATSSVYLGSLTLGTKLANAQLANSSLTVTAGNGISGCGTVSLGGTITCSANLNGTTLSNGASGLSLNLGSANTWTAGETFANSTTTSLALALNGSFILNDATGTITQLTIAHGSSPDFIATSTSRAITQSFIFNVATSTITNVFITNLTATSTTKLYKTIQYGTSTLSINEGSSTPSQELTITGDEFISTKGTTSIQMDSITSGKLTCIQMKATTGVFRLYLTDAAGTISLKIEAGSCK